VEEEGKAVGMRGRLPHGKGRATHLESQFIIGLVHGCAFVCLIIGHSIAQFRVAYQSI
jgi:hypothetical protein